jgi:hypothetical protein
MLPALLLPAQLLRSKLVVLLLLLLAMLNIPVPEQAAALAKGNLLASACSSTPAAIWFSGEVLVAVMKAPGVGHSAAVHCS